MNNNNQENTQTNTQENPQENQKVNSGEPKNQTRFILLAVVLITVIVLYFSGILQKEPVTVEILKPEIIKSNYHFIHEHWQEKKLAQLIQEENFKDISAKNQWDLYVKLTAWTHNQWKLGNPDPYPLSNGVDILRDIRSGKTSGFCGQYAYLLADVLKSMGFYTVRYVELWSNERELKSHFAVEAWCDQYGKWVVLDPTFNVVFLFPANGTPANALEIRAALFGGPAVKTHSITNDPKIKPNQYMDYFANFAVSLRSDLMRHTSPLTVQDRFSTFLFFHDTHTKPGFCGDKIPYRLISGRKADLYYDCNSTIFKYTVDAENHDVTITLHTDGSTPNFRNFNVSTDSGKTWNPLPGNSLRIKKQNTPFLLMAAAVNMQGRPGTINKILVQW